MADIVLRKSHLPDAVIKFVDDIRICDFQHRMISNYTCQPRIDEPMSLILHSMGIPTQFVVARVVVTDSETEIHSVAEW
jgi:hypothetical protein